MQEPYSPRLRVTPPITAGAYTSGNVVGGLQTLVPFGRSLTGVLKTLLVKDADAQKSAMTVLIFDDLPNGAGGVYADKFDIVWGTGDFTKCIGRVSIVASDYVTVAGKALADIDLTRVVGNGASPKVNKLYAICVLAGVPTFTTTSALEFQYGFLMDP